MTFPAEIVGHILTFLQSDTETLRKCSRSHPFLSSLVEPHLYSRILLKRNDLSCVRTFSPWDFAMLLSERPYIANYVRDLEIHVYGDDSHYATFLLEKVSHILPMILSLRRITVNHHAAPYPFSWRAQPNCFRLAFWACLRLPSMRQVCLENVTNFLPTSFLDNRYGSLNGLTLRSCCRMGSLEDDVDPPRSSHSSESLPFESLCFEPGDPDAFTDWFTTDILRRLRSLRYSSKNYKSLSKLLTSCSTTLVNLYLDIGLSGTYLYNSRTDPPTIQKPKIDMPNILSMVPCLEELTIRSPLNFYNCSRRGYGFHCAIPVIAKIFSNKLPSVLKRLTLNFDCHRSRLPDPLTVSNVICIPLTELLSCVSAFSPSIQVNVVVNENSLMSFEPSTELPPLLSLLRDSEEIMGFFKH